MFVFLYGDENGNERMVAVCLCLCVHWVLVLFVDVVEIRARTIHQLPKRFSFIVALSIQIVFNIFCDKKIRGIIFSRCFWCIVLRFAVYCYSGVCLSNKYIFFFKVSLRLCVNLRIKMIPLSMGLVFAVFGYSGSFSSSRRIIKNFI